MANSADQIESACKLCYGAGGIVPCNFFTQGVARMLGIAVPGGNADEMVLALSRQWRRAQDKAEVISLATGGGFIIAGLESSAFVPRPGHTVTHGHVCVVVQGEMGGYPHVFSTNDDKKPGAYGKSRGDHPLSGFVFAAQDAARVRYFVHAAGASGSW